MKMIPTGTKRRVVFVLPSYDPKTGSHFFHLYEFLELAAKELDLVVIVERSSAPISYHRAELSHLGSQASWYHQKFSSPPLRFLELMVVFSRERLRGRKHIYSHYSYYGAIASWLVTRLLGGKNYYWNCGEPWKYRRRCLTEALFRFILRHSTLVTGTIGLARAYAMRYSLKPGRIRVCPNGINLDRFGSNSSYAYDRNHKRRELGISPDAKVILFVHHLSRRKGAHLIPEIARQVTAARKDVIFLVVGTGPEGGTLESRIKNLELERYVRLVGEVPQREIPGYFQAADIFFMPSEEEGFPHVLLEAMASSVPYVSSDVGGVREITPPELQDFIVPSGNIGTFAVKIMILLEKPPSETAALSAAECEWVKRYDVRAALPAFSALFRD